MVGEETGFREDFGKESGKEGGLALANPTAQPPDHETSWGGQAGVWGAGTWAGGSEEGARGLGTWGCSKWPSHSETP